MKPTNAVDDVSSFIEGPDCNCPSDCEETLYYQEMSQAKIRDRNRFMKKLQLPGQFLYNLTEQIKNETKQKKKEKLQKLFDNIIDTSSIVHIYFKELGVVKYSKDQLYGALDVIGKLKLQRIVNINLLINIFLLISAAFGGLVGLCIGFSILSGVEIIYWFTIRLYLDYCRRKTKK